MRLLSIAILFLIAVGSVSSYIPSKSHNGFSTLQQTASSTPALTPLEVSDPPQQSQSLDLNPEMNVRFSQEEIYSLRVLNTNIESAPLPSSNLTYSEAVELLGYTLAGFMEKVYDTAIALDMLENGENKTAATLYFLKVFTELKEQENNLKTSFQLVDAALKELSSQIPSNFNTTYNLEVATFKNKSVLSENLPTSINCKLEQKFGFNVKLL